MLSETLDRSIESLIKITIDAKQRLAVLGIATVRDLIYHIPHSTIDRSRLIDSSFTTGYGSCVAKVLSHHPPIKRGGAYRIICNIINEPISLEIVFFKLTPNFLRYLSSFSSGTLITLSGKFASNGFVAQISHPDFIVLGNQLSKIAILEPIYPLTYGLNNNMLRKIIDSALKILPQNLEEWLPLELMQKYNYPNWLIAIHAIHNPESAALTRLAKDRLASDEIMAHQIAISHLRASDNLRAKEFTLFRCDKTMREDILKTAGFALTAGQKSVLAEIEQDSFDKKRMTRLLQGDVGSGKTIIALLAAINYINSNMSVIIVAPTNILAAQHARYIARLTQDSINLVLLTAKTGARVRRKIFDHLDAGVPMIIVATHAIFHLNRNFANLGFVVIDEQHRFGVEQRLILSKNSPAPDLLLMSATPIPRTMAMAIYGDISISWLREKPENRKKIDSRIMKINKAEELLHKLSQKLSEAKEKAFWICPLINENEELDMMACEERHKIASKILGEEKVAILHGKMKQVEKDKIMEEFADPNSQLLLLIATTVIEVGIDIQSATVIVIEHAERFGIAQLHQLRGRVGRSNIPSSCIMLASDNASPQSMERLIAVKNSDDGFKLAETDLKMRGSGDLLGVKQSGDTSYRIASFEEHYYLFEEIHQYLPAASFNENLMALFNYNFAMVG